MTLTLVEFWLELPSGDVIVIAGATTSRTMSTSSLAPVLFAESWTQTRNLDAVRSAFTRTVATEPGTV